MQCAMLTLPLMILRKDSSRFSQIPVKKAGGIPLSCPNMTDQRDFAAKGQSLRWEDKAGVLVAKGKSTGSSRCRHTALCLCSLSRLYNKWMLAGGQRHTGNNKHRKAQKPALLVS